MGLSKSVFLMYVTLVKEGSANKVSEMFLSMKINETVCYVIIQVLELVSLLYANLAFPLAASIPGPFFFPPFR